ncbi:MAG TPA: glycosyltransferase [Thermoanaerobaculia bacterium]|nr:glycosyltransferase [Thermoanaerobaculia bacterium]
MPGRALVVVLGDLDRSPRMQRQAASLARAGWVVEMIGFGEWEQEGVAVRRIASFDRLRGRRLLTFVSMAAMRQAALVVALGWALLRTPRPSVILAAIPPALPTLPLLLIAARRWRARLILDWHNLTGAMLSLRPGGRLLAGVARRLETRLARHASAHLAVSQEMAGYLSANGLAPVTILPDRAPAAFRPAETLRPDAPTVIAPTGWSADEAVEMLPEVATLLDRRLAGRDAGVQISLLITGKGERRAAIEAQLSGLRLQRVAVHTAWLPNDQYRQRLRASVLGLSFHRSASGLDLPMKIAEMLGSGVPVCAFDFGAVLREQMRPGEEGCLFSTPAELAALLDDLLGTWPETPAIDRMAAALRNRPFVAWEEQWDDTAAPLFG